MLRWVWLALLGCLGVVGCQVASPAPPAPSLSVPLVAEFPPGAEREHIALREALGHNGTLGERRQTYYQFADHPFNIGPGWCATTPAQTADNWRHMRWRLTVDGVEIRLADFPLSDTERITGVCRMWLVVIPALPPGEHEVVYTLALDAPIGDGTYRYPAGEYVTRLRLVSIPRQPVRPTLPTSRG